MFTRRALIAASLTLKVFCLPKFLPFDWNYKKFELTAVNKIHSQIFFFLHWVNIWTHLIFLTISYDLNKNDLLESPPRLFLHVIWWSSFVLGALYSTYAYFHRCEVAEFVNQLFSVLQDDCIQGQEVKQNARARVRPTSKPKRPPLDWCELLLKFFLAGGLNFAGCASLLFFVDPYSSRYFYSAFVGNNVAIFIIFGFWQFVNALEFCASITFFVMIILLFLFGMTTWLKISRFKNPIEHQFKTYRKLLVFCKEFNLCFRSVIIPSLQVLGILLPVTCYHVVIRFHDISSFKGILLVLCLISLSSCSIIFTTFTWPTAAELYTKSTGFLKFVKTEHRASISTKEVKAMRAFKVECSNVTYVQRITAYKLLGSVLYGTGKSLLIFKH